MKKILILLGLSCQLSISEVHSTEILQPKIDSDALSDLQGKWAVGSRDYCDQKKGNYSIDAYNLYSYVNEKIHKSPIIVLNRNSDTTVFGIEVGNDLLLMFIEHNEDGMPQRYVGNLLHKLGTKIQENNFFSDNQPMFLCDK